MRYSSGGIAAKVIAFLLFPVSCVSSLLAVDSTFYWNPSPVRVGASIPAGTIDSTTIPGSKILSTDATGFGLATPSSESLLFASIPCSASGLIEWTAPDPIGGSMTAGSVAGVMLRFGDGSSPGAPFVFAGVRQGASGVELRWRVTQNGELKTVTGAISATDFPASSRLKLEVVQGRVFLSYKKTGDLATDPWRKRLAVEIPSGGVVVSGLALATGGSGVASLEVPNDHVNVAPVRAGSPWVRLVEPVDVLGIGAPADRLSMKNSAFTWADLSTESEATLESGPTAGEYSGGDYWKWYRDEADWTMDPSLVERVTTVFNEIYPKLPQDTLDLYVRYGPITSHTAEPTVESLIWDSETVLSNHTVEEGLGDGLWVYLATLPKPVYSDPALELTMGWTFEDSPSGLKNEGCLDGLLLVGQVSYPDGNDDGLPDDFGGVYAPWLTVDGDFDGDGLSNWEEYVLGLSPTTSQTSVLPTVAVVAPSTAPWHLARGRWSALPAEFSVTYPGTSPPVPVKGYGLSLYSPESTIGFGTSRTATPWKGDMLLLSSALGIAKAHIWLDPECPTPVGSSSSGHDIKVRSFGATFKVRPYDNLPPGPVDVIANNVRLSKVGSLPLVSPTSMALADDWLALSGNLHPYRGLSLLRWNPMESTWVATSSLWLDKSFSSICSDGMRLTGATPQLGFYEISTAGYGEESAGWHTLGESAYASIPQVPVVPLGYTPRLRGYEWVLQGSQEYLYTFRPSLAMNGSWLAVGNGSWDGQVEVFERVGQSWVLRTTLHPDSGKHSDAFGVALCFSEDGKRLIVGAPGDTQSGLPGRSIQEYNATILVPVSHTEDVYDWVDDGNGNLVWQVVGQHNWTEDEESTVSTLIPPSAKPTVYIYKRDENDDWSEEGRVVSPTEGVSLTHELERFGTSVAAIGNLVVVGTPCRDPGYGEAPGAIHTFELSGGTWSLRDSKVRSNPRFGEKLLTSRGHAIAVTMPRQSQFGFQGNVSVFAPGSTELIAVSEITVPNDRVVATADDDSLVITESYYVAREYQWLPAVDWDATEGETVVGWIKSADADLANANAAIEQVSLLVGTSPRWALDTSLSLPGAPPHQPFETAPKALKVKLGANLDLLAPALDWLEVSAVDRAGDRHTEFLGIRVIGQAPSVPVLQSVNAATSRMVRVAWSPASHTPSTYVIETADQAVLQDLLDNGGTPQQIEDAFSERARVGGDVTSYYHQVASPGDIYTLKLAFRVRAINEEGISGASNFIVVDFDGDNDSLPDWWEDLNGGDLNPSLDDDSDGLTNLQEYLAGTNPLVADTDADGSLDGSDTEPLNSTVNDLSFVLYTPVE